MIYTDLNSQMRLLQQLWDQVASTEYTSTRNKVTGTR